MNLENIFLTMIFVIFGVCLVWKTLRGRRRGTYREIVHVCITIVSCVIAFFIARSVVEMTLNGTLSNSVRDLLAEFMSDSEQDGSVNSSEIVTNSSSLNLMLVLPVGTIIAPIVFVLAYLVVNLLMQLVYVLICRVFNITEPIYEPKKNAIGAAIGAFEGLVVAIIMVTPIVGYSTLINDSVDVIRENDNGEYTDFIESYDEGFGRVGDNFVVKAADFLGSGIVLEGLSSIKVDGVVINLRDETVSALAVFMNFKGLDELDTSNLSDGGKAAFRSAVNEIDKSDYIKMLLSATLRDMGESTKNEGTEFINAEPPYDMLVNDVIELFVTSNKDNIISDINTVLDVYFLLSDGGVVELYGNEGAESDMRDSLVAEDDSGVTLIKAVIDILESNEHTKPLVNTVVKMTIIMLADQLGIDSDAAMAYENIKNDFTEVLSINREDYDTEEEYIAARNTAIDEKLRANEIELDGEIINGIGDYVDDNYGDLDELNDEQFNYVILSYYEVFVEINK